MLEEYEEICPDCKDEPNWYNMVCKKCGGRGKIDWIDKVKGVRTCPECAGSGNIGVEIQTNELTFRGNKYRAPGILSKILCPVCMGSGVCVND